MLKPYKRINFKDHVVDAQTKAVIQQGDPLSANNMRHIEDAIESVTSEAITLSASSAALEKSLEVLDAANIKQSIMAGEDGKPISLDAFLRSQSKNAQAQQKELLKYLAEIYTKADIAALFQKKPNPNLLINGELIVWQRGTSFTNPNNAYTADRWKCNGTGTVSKATENGGMKITGPINLRYIIEDIDYNQVAGETVTLSYSKDGEIISDTYTASSSTVVDIDLADCTIDWIKLEIGDKATPFIPRLIAEVLALCQRYYQIFQGLLGVTAYSINPNTISFALQFRSIMRVAPTVKGNVDAFNFGPSASTWNKGFSISLNSVSTTEAQIVGYKTNHVLSTANQVHVSANPIELDAEI